MSEPYKTFTHNGRTVSIYFDDNPMSPRDADNLGIMLANGHRKYTLGDEDFQQGLDGEYAAAEEALSRLHEKGKIHKFPKWCKKHLGSKVVLALGLHDHSGISMYVAGSWQDTGDASNRFDPGGWDSGLVGFIFDTAKRRKVCFGEEEPTVETIEQGLRAEVDVYDDYLTGQVFGYVIEDEDGEEVGSCWGMFDIKYVVAEARDAAGYTCKHCQRPLKRWVGPVMDAAPEGDERSLLHSCCATCGDDVEWGGDGWMHLGTKPWDWPDGKPDHAATISHRHKCLDGEHFADTDQTVGEHAA